jgi:nucleoside-diphosphate-sugar epimerase
MEGYRRDYDEDEPPFATTEYAKVNAENESVWCSSGEDRATVLRISNFFCRPQGRESPQSGLLPWSLAAEAREYGTITMRSGANLVKDFVTGADVAAAALLLAEHDDAPRACVTSPGAALSLRMLADETACAIERVSGSRPVVSFGPDGEQAPRCSPGWLAERGWSSSLTAGWLREEIETWLRVTSISQRS